MKKKLKWQRDSKCDVHNSASPTLQKQKQQILHTSWEALLGWCCTRLWQSLATAVLVSECELSHPSCFLAHYIILILISLHLISSQWGEITMGRYIP